jgi:hypothetical protein
MILRINRKEKVIAYRTRDMSTGTAKKTVPCTWFVTHNMVDRDARDKAAIALRKFADGDISNEQYEKQYPKSDSDLGLAEIFLQIWFLYSDLKEHKLTDKYTLGAEQSAFVERCVLFLTSDLEFEWPPQRLHLWRTFIRFLELDKTETTASGDEAVWPFLDDYQYEQTRVSQQLKIYEI